MKTLSKTNEVLRECRERSGLSQIEVAKLAETSQRSISAYELGYRKPSVTVAVRLAKIYKCKVTDLFSEEKIHVI